MSIPPECHLPRPEVPESGTLPESTDDDYERLWQNIPPLDPDLEPNENRPAYGYSITSPREFVDAEISADAEKLYDLLLTDGNPRDFIEWWAASEGINLKTAMADLNRYGVLETHPYSGGGIRVKRKFFSQIDQI